MNLTITNRNSGVTQFIFKNDVTLLIGEKEKKETLFDAVNFVLFNVGGERFVDNEVREVTIELNGKKFTRSIQTSKLENSSEDELNEFIVTDLFNLTNLNEDILFRSDFMMHRFFQKILLLKTHSGNQKIKIEKIIESNKRICEESLKEINKIYKSIFIHTKNIKKNNTDSISTEMERINGYIQQLPKDIKEIKNISTKNEKESWNNFSSLFNEKFLSLKITLEERQKLESEYWMMHALEKRNESEERQLIEYNNNLKNARHAIELHQSLLMIVTPEVEQAFEDMINDITQIIKDLDILSEYKIDLSFRVEENAITKILKKDGQEIDFINIPENKLINLVLNLALLKYLSSPIVLFNEVDALDNMSNDSNDKVIKSIKKNFINQKVIITSIKLISRNVFDEVKDLDAFF